MPLTRVQTASGDTERGQARPLNCDVLTKGTEKKNEEYISRTQP